MINFQGLERLHRDIENIGDIDFLGENIQVLNADSIELLGYLRVSKDIEKRMDKLSYRLYGRNYYIEHVMIFNDMVNPYDFFEGDILALPDLASFLNNLEIRQYQEKFIANNKAAFNIDGEILVANNSKTPNRRFKVNSGRKVNTPKVKIDQTNGILIF